MPFNQTKIYNELLDILSLNEAQRTKSLRLIFERDFVDKSPVFQKKEIYPTPQANGEIPMDTLFRHLTTEMQDTQDPVHRQQAFRVGTSSSTVPVCVKHRERGSLRYNLYDA